MAIPSLAMIPSGYKEGKVYSVLPTNGDGDFTFSRGSNATRVNKDGLIETMPLELGEELVTNGDFATDSDWIKGSGWSISGGEANCSGSGTGQVLYQQNIMPLGTKYKITVTVSSFVSGYLSAFGGDWDTEIIQSNGTFTRYTKSLSVNTGFVGNNFIGSIDNVSVKEVISGYDTPRLDYTDSSCPSLLLEPQSTNLITYSEDFSQWSALNNVVVTDNFITSPDGTQNAAKLVFDGTASGRIELSVSASGTNTQSIYLKTESGTQNVSIGAGGVDLTQFTITDQWVRYTHTGGGDFPRILCNDSATIYVYGAQLEALSYPTSYIPTNGAIATRLADVCNSAGNDQVINSSEGVLYAEIVGLSNPVDSPKNITISDGTLNNYVRIEYYQDGRVYGNVFDGTNTAANSVVNQLNFNKVAVQYSSSGCKLYVNGIGVDFASKNFTSNTLNTVQFSSASGNSDFFHGNVKDVRVYNTALTEQELTDLTTI